MANPTPITRATLDLSRLAKPQGHKYSHGHALVLTGGPGQTGAARLAAHAALRVGAGAVTLGVPPAAQFEVALHETAVMIQRITDGAALAAALDDPRVNALCLGPALGLGETRRDLIRVAMGAGRSCVLDADALTHLSQDTGLVSTLHHQVVLTPHEGEFRRLFPGVTSAGDLTSRADAAREAAAISGAVVLLKGADTLIATPEGACAHHAATGARAVPWLATAGAGDTLAGIITGLMARGFPGYDAAQFGAFLHVECALAVGPGLIAEDLAQMLPQVLRAHLP